METKTTISSVRHTAFHIYIHFLRDLQRSVIQTCVKAGGNNMFGA
ncbi:MAG: hypothetical protein V4732_18345 [Pseudomonadota bacterium]